MKTSSTDCFFEILSRDRYPDREIQMEIYNSYATNNKMNTTKMTSYKSFYKEYVIQCLTKDILSKYIFCFF